jgi:hypothetical protein
MEMETMKIVGNENVAETLMEYAKPEHSGNALAFVVVGLALVGGGYICKAAYQYVVKPIVTRVKAKASQAKIFRKKVDNIVVMEGKVVSEKD